MPHDPGPDGCTGCDIWPPNRRAHTPAAPAASREAREDWLPRHRKGGALLAARPCRICGQPVRLADIGDGLRAHTEPAPVPAGQVRPTWPAWWWSDTWGLTDREPAGDARRAAAGELLFVLHPCDHTPQPAQGEPCMTSPFGNYVEPVAGDGDQYKPKEHAGAHVIAKIRELKHGIVTEHSPEGGDGLVVDVLDLTDGQVYREVLWMGGAWVDGLKEHVGKEPVVLTITAAKSKQGRTYYKPQAGPVELAQQYWAAKGDPFMPTFSAPTPEAPAAAAAPAGAAPWAQ